MGLIWDIGFDWRRDKKGEGITDSGVVISRMLC